MGSLLCRSVAAQSENVAVTSTPLESSNVMSEVPLEEVTEVVMASSYSFDNFDAQPEDIPPSTRMYPFRYLCSQLPQLRTPVYAPRDALQPWEKPFPPEVLCIIWSFLANISRDVCVTEARNHPGLMYQSRNPEVMQICRESRTVGKKFYELCTETFGSKTLNSWPWLQRPYDYDSLRANKLWINFAVDRFVVMAKRENICTLGTLQEYNFHPSVFDRMERLVLVIPGMQSEQMLFTCLCQQKRLVCRSNVTTLTIRTSVAHLFRNTTSPWNRDFEQDLENYKRVHRMKANLIESIQHNQKTHLRQKVVVDLEFDGEVVGEKDWM
ncbi:hypothetical protein N431DRAFT_447157 [Stipitochalara longipes BDJ]|nr:hypothetical protein N431DRAFT_447157 [Stipitochalara longipes BDJ]